VTKTSWRVFVIQWLRRRNTSKSRRSQSGLRADRIKSVLAIAILNIQVSRQRLGRDQLLILIGAVVPRVNRWLCGLKPALGLGGGTVC